MKRRHLFEFNEAAWLPPVLRALVTGYLSALSAWIRPFSAQLPLMAQALRSTGADAGVVDLCAGDGGPWQHLAPQLETLTARRVPIVLTDIYPPCRARPASAPAVGIEWHTTPVDALAVPAHLRGMRTVFNGFHHFRPTQAKALLRNAVDSREPVVIMELLRRDATGLLTALFTPLLVWAITPWIRPFSWLRLLLTYVLPLAPLLIWWDTFVSVLRCYTPDELRAMGQQISGGAYVWHAGTYRNKLASVTFLIGYPRDTNPADSA